MSLQLVTFCDASMSRAADLCVSSAYQHGVDKAHLFTWDAIKGSSFVRDNAELFAHPRGIGYFAWKPYVILEAMKFCDENDFLVYSDAGIEFIDNLKYITDRMPPGQDAFLFANAWQHIDWCKADTLYAILPDAKFEEFGFQVQASLLFFRVSQWSRDFVSEWLSYCIQPHLIDDSPSVAPNAPTFREHRHDQAILHCLSVKHQIQLHWYPIVYNRFSGPMFTHEKGEHLDNYPPLAHHHRLRNHEFPESRI
jgi:hypothetical protein